MQSVFGFRIFFARHREFEENAELFENAFFISLFCQIQTAGDFDGERCGEDRVFAEEIYFYLHRLSEETFEINVVPRFFVVFARAVIADVNEMVFDRVAENVFEQRAFGFDF